MSTLLVGYDSAWTVGKSGGLVGAYLDECTLLDLGELHVANFDGASCPFGRRA
jgi:hypothetical protein